MIKTNKSYFNVALLLGIWTANAQSDATWAETVKFLIKL